MKLLTFDGTSLGDGNTGWISRSGSAWSSASAAQTHS